MQLKFTVVAGKYDGHERNAKYINDFDTLEEALNDVDDKSLTDYPFCEIEVHEAMTGPTFIIECKNPVYINTRT